MRRASDKTQDIEDSAQQLIEQLVQRAHDLYCGERLTKRASGVAIAETFGRRVTAYHGLSHGGFNGDGECGAIIAGRLVLAEFLGNSDPKEIKEGILVEAVLRYQQQIARRVQGRGSTDFVCSSLIAAYDDYSDPERLHFCCRLVSEVSRILAEILIDYKKLDNAQD